MLTSGMEDLWARTVKPQYDYSPVMQNKHTKAIKLISFRKKLLNIYFALKLLND